MTYKTDKYFWIANIVIVISLVLFFSRSLFTDRIQAPADFKTYPFFVSHNSGAGKPEQILYDPIVQHIPWFHFDKQVLKTGKLPLWNPYQGCGVPHIANMQSALFYPLNIFVYLLNWKWGFIFLYFFKLYFIGLFLYLYLKEIGISGQVAILTSLSSLFMGFNIIYYLYVPLGNVVFFFPLALWTIELILKNPKHYKGYLIFCAGFVMAVLGGNPELLLYSTFTIVLYLLGRLYQTYRLDSYNEYVSIIIRFSTVLLVGILISSIQLLPFLEYLRFSSAYLSRDILDLPLNNLPGYLLLFNIVPSLPIHSRFALTELFNQYHSIVIYAYVGVSLLLLSIAGMFALHKDNIVKIFMLILIISLCVGFYIPFVHEIIMKIPGFNIGRSYYMLIFAGWAVIIISNKTLDNFIQGQIALRTFTFAGIIIIGLIIILGFFFVKDAFFLIPLYLRQTISSYLILSEVATIAIILLTLLILKIIKRQILLMTLGILIYIQTALPIMFIEPPIKPAFFYPNNNLFSMLQNKQGNPFRVTALIGNNKPIAYATNINTFYELEDIRNYDSLGINWYDSIFLYLKLGDALNLTNVRYLIEGKNFDVSAFTNIFQPVTEYNGYILYKNLSAFDRAFVVYNYAIADGDQQALDLLHVNSGQLNKVAIVFRKDIQGMSLTATAQGTYAINFIKYTPGYIKLSCNTSQPGLFFISDTYFPGWHARVDGEATKIIRADYAFQGIWLSQGTHTIELNYDPASFKYGALLSIIGILSLIGFYLIVFRKKKL